MNNNNKVILGILALILAFGSVVPGNVAAAGKKDDTKSQKTAKAQKPTAPIVIEGDELSFSDETGDVYAKGKVVVTNQEQTIETEKMEGNTKRSEVWIKDQFTFTEPDAKLDGSNMIYNYDSRTGTMEAVKGKVDREIVSGKNVYVFPDEVIIHNGTATRCPAKIPDYHVSAEKIEIWPGKKMIAYNAKFWIKNTVIFTLPKYQKSLKKGEEGESDFPSVGYDNDDGLRITQYLEYPLSDKLSAYADIGYYSKRGFKPIFGLTDREQDYSWSLFQGDFKDANNYWITKEPELSFQYHPRRLGTLPVTYQFTASYGKWTDSAKSSWHQDYQLYFTRDPIQLNKSLTLNLGTGVEHIRESYDNSSNTVYKFDTLLDKQWSPRFNTWAGYHFVSNNTSLFSYNSVSNSRELFAGFTYKIDSVNTIGINRTYNMQTHTYEDLDYTWYRNLHCWQATLTYRAKQKETRFDISLTRW
ncbi:MAG TPA: LPS export ABC transporter periplasmic protein LptC [Methylomusa anaerophila]|uniref:LPS-assembly protein LptD n=1 Tax=Methylomusa anaerophila TaxID=1930071 RepID=A0A348AKJ5_9FIRM|nr:LPS export ABC transporter periplasmic protein LptC [Methylomusa anaerophila]BBB91593.1 LPS-assembly protein LptD [Methylomusa anaerophila]HML89469.1 LPS export ABC transporter periplasmic protein LptC [Methylomusa anaerophila]